MLPAREASLLLRAMARAAAAAGRVLELAFEAERPEVEIKGDGSPVSVADRQAEHAAREVLAEERPRAGVLGEELGQLGASTERFVLDPLDGTKNFLDGLPYFAVLIGYEREGERLAGLVHAPLLGQCWWGLCGRGAFSSCELPLAGEWDAGRRLRARPTTHLADALVLHGGLAHLMRAGAFEDFGRVVARARRTRGFGDFHGHMLVAEGRADAMIDPLVAFHDLAALEPILAESGAVLACERGRRLEAGYRGAALSAASAELCDDLRKAMTLFLPALTHE